MQKKDNPLDKCEIKFDTTEKGVFEGYASGFNLVDAYKDTIIPGAYTKTIEKGRSIKMFVNHDSREVPVGDWTNLKEDDTGLLVTGKIDLNHKDGTTVHSAMKRGAMDGLSIGFTIPAGGAKETEEGIRELSDIDLKEISVVNFPADDSARISAVKFEIEQIESFRDAEAILRDAGYSKSAAKAFVSRVKALSRRDAGYVEDENTKDITTLFIERFRKL